MAPSPLRLARARSLPALVAVLSLLAAAARAEGPARTPLREGWRLQSSALVRAAGAEISTPGFAAEGWHTITVPNTVVGALVENGTYPDPYFGMNLRQIPGTTYPIGQRFTLLPMPADSPFKPSWWYRTEFEVPAAAAGGATFVQFEGINYRANVWLNGHLLADAKEVAGAFRRYDFDVSRWARAGAPNALAVEVTAPEPHDLAFMWVDWNPTPADKNMGLWGPVSVVYSGPVALRNPQVVTKLDLPALDRARLSVSAELVNTTAFAVKGTLRGAIEERRFAAPFSLGPQARTTVRFSADTTPELDVARPRVWWPYRMGTPEMYTLSLEVEADGALSDRATVPFGIREATSELTAEGHRLFKVNGRPVLVRGGGWASDMLLRPAGPERLEAELRYTREMGLNTIRLEGKLESDLFYDLADQSGLLVMPGWCCCDQWEMWDKWDEEDHRVAPASLRDQILRLRNHPSMLVWLNGSDFPPPARVEKAYLDVLQSCEWPNPVLSNATDTPGPVSGPSGVKMRGPYDYVPPSYWLRDTKNGGAFGFATEIGPGGAVPPIESLKRMLPADRLWPVNPFWAFHAGGDEFKDLRLFTGALEGRYGKAKSAEDYARKAQALAYEGQRAMFEGYARNKYTSTGVIQWMLNNAWPSLIWHLYDYYLRPGGGYFGAKKAGQPLNVQYSYDDRSVAVVNDTHLPAPGLQVRATLLDFALKERFTQDARLDLGADAVARALTIPEIPGLAGVHFLRLSLRDAAGKALASNFYWLSTRDDVLDWKKTEWYYTPVRRHADLTQLERLPTTALRVSAGYDPPGPETSGAVKIENAGSALAFQVRLKLTQGEGGEEVLPVYWEDNYFELLPGESREVAVRFPTTFPGRGRVVAPVVEAEAWNAPRVVY